MTWGSDAQPRRITEGLTSWVGEEVPHLYVPLARQGSYQVPFRSSVFRGHSCKLDAPFVNGGLQSPHREMRNLRNLSGFLQTRTSALTIPAPDASSSLGASLLPHPQVLLHLGIPDSLSQLEELPGRMWFSKSGPRPAASAPPGNLLEMKILGPQLRPTESEILG